MHRKKLAIIGNGMAAGRLLDDLVRRDGLRHYHVTVFGEEPHGCYNRILLSRVLAGAAPDDIMLKPPEWYAERGVRFRAGAAVATLDAAGRGAGGSATSGWGVCASGGRRGASGRRSYSARGSGRW